MADSSAVLAALAAGILDGGIKVVDLTVPLEPATPTIQLPPQFAPSKPFSLEEPGFHPDTLPFLTKQRDILGVGVETVGTDAGQAATFNPMFPCHTLMHGANRFGLASLMNLDQLPPTGAVVIAPPLKIVNGSGSPLRVLALIPG